jgi:hypothetical protein
LLAAPVLARRIVNDTSDSVELEGDVFIEVITASHAVRGYAIGAALVDELAFFPGDDSSVSGQEIVSAIRPAMATIPNSLLVCASSPYARRGPLWESFKRYYGVDDPNVLVWRAPTLVMNPSVPQRIIDEAYEADPASAAAEYGAEFRTDVETFVAREAVEACVSLGVRERPPLADMDYAAFIDPSGGSADSMTVAIGHRDGDATVIDAIRERLPPFSPDDVCAEFAALLKNYRVSKVVGDRYAGEWPRERLASYNIGYEPAERPKSDLYRDMLPLINSRRIELLDDRKLVNQLCGLERRTTRAGRDSIDSAPNSHEDIANSVAGVANVLQASSSYWAGDLAWVRGPEDEPPPPSANPRPSIYAHPFFNGVPSWLMR